MTAEHRERMTPSKRGTAGTQLEAHDPRRVYVDGGGCWSILREFGRHVFRCADETRESCDRRSGSGPSDPEIGELPERLVRIGEIHEHVFRFDITMDDSGCVRDREAFKHVGAKPSSRIGGEGSRGGGEATQIRTVYTVHHDREGVALCDQVAHWNEVRPSQADQQRPFLQEPCDELGIVHELASQNFDSDFLPRVARGAGVDLTHRSAAESLPRQIVRTDGSQPGLVVRRVSHPHSYSDRRRLVRGTAQYPAPVNQVAA
jgi:hypothetical protein